MIPGLNKLTVDPIIRKGIDWEIQLERIKGELTKKINFIEEWLNNPNTSPLANKYMARKRLKKLKYNLLTAEGLIHVLKNKKSDSN